MSTSKNDSGLNQDQQAGHGHRSEHRVDRGAAVLGPVHVGQMQDQRELVEHERGADAEERRGDRELGHPAVYRQGHHGYPGDHDQHDTDHDVVDVHGAVRDVAGLPPSARLVAVGVAADVAHHGSGHEEGEDERQQAAHQRQAIAWDEIEVDGRLHDVRTYAQTGASRPWLRLGAAATDSLCWR